jgi:hypothetical protein
MDTYSKRLDPAHRDYELLTKIERALVRQAGGWEKFSVDIPRLLRQAIDEVIDSHRSGRFTVAELEKTEKTYLGTKVEILLRNHLKLKKGKVLDLDVDGIEVDVKNTIRKTWTIPNEAHNQPCLFISTDDKKAVCNVGLMLVRPEVLGGGRNRDDKGAVAARSFEHIHWLLFNAPYPENFWEKIGRAALKKLTAPKGGTERLILLFRTYQEQPISRMIVQALVGKKDYMKRLRKNGGARDQLHREGIALLSGNYDQATIVKLGLPATGKDYFISFKPHRKEDIDLLRNLGKIS